MSRPRGDTGVLVVAADTPARLRAWADYVCTGVNDQVVINRALQEGRHVRLAPGTFVISDSIELRQGYRLDGSGMAVTYISAAIGNPIDCIRWALPPQFEGIATGGSATTITFAGDQRAFISAGQTIRIRYGQGAGQKRVVQSVSFNGGNTTVTITGNNFSPVPAAGSACVIDAVTTGLFASVRDMTITGRRYRNDFPSGNKAYLGTVGSHTDGRLVDSANRTFPSWVVGKTLLIYTGTAAYEARRIIGLGTTVNANDTLLLDGPIWDNPTGASYAVVGHGIAIYGGNCFDIIFENIWPTQHCGAGIYSESGWGMIWNNLICEYNDVGGVFFHPAPSAVMSTSTWKASAGQLVTVLSKAVNCKLVANGPYATSQVVNTMGSGLIVVGRTIEGRFSACEFGTDVSYGHGIYLHGKYNGTVKTLAITGNSFSSWDTVDGGTASQAGIYLGPSVLNVAVVGNTCRLNATYGPKYFTFVPAGGGQMNVIAGNAIEHATNCVAFGGSSGGNTTDATGWNLYRCNLINGTANQDSFEGRLSAAADANKDVALTFPAALMNLPSGANWHVLFSPVDQTTASVSGWFVQSVSNTGVTLRSANATTGTTYTFNVRVVPMCRRTANG